MQEEKNLGNNELNDQNIQQEEESTFNFKTIMALFILNWQWFILSMFIAICCALLYLRYKSPLYQVSSKMLIKDDQDSRRRGSNQMLANMQDFGFISNSNGIDNEVEILQSHLLAREAVKDLKLYVEYKLKGKVKDHLIYNTQNINVDIDPVSLEKLDESELPIKYSSIRLRLSKDKGRYLLKGKSHDDEGEEVSFEREIDKFPATIKTPVGTLFLSKNTSKNIKLKDKKSANRDLIITIYPPKYIAASYIKRLSIEPTSKTTSIALLTLKDKNPNRAEDFLRQLASCYNQQANADKNEIAVKTEAFINSRLEKINAELGSTEGELENYKKRYNLTQLRLDATENLAQASEYSSKLSEAMTQLELLSYLKEFINDPKNSYQIIPTNVGLEDQSSTTLINQYNKDVLERNRLLGSASELAPQVVIITKRLDEVQQSIKTALQQATQAAEIKRKGIESQYSIYKDKVANTPEQERILTQIGRQQEVKSGLYLMLLQKREENSISLAATADKGKLIDDPIIEGKVSPKGSIILLVALAVGFALPLIFIYIVQLLRYKIEGHEDVARLTNLPIVADVAVANESAKSSSGIVVKENQNDQIDEIFRSMRTNIQFMLKGEEKVIMFTSSTSGEGKTFNAANLAVSFALLGKRVVLLGLDIRKPALGRLFGISDRTGGITPLLTRETLTTNEIEAQLRPSDINKNLDLMLAGPVPPNPTELLARDNMGMIINHLKDLYDYVILDTAPIGLVTDTLQIGKLADVTVFVCRADYTPKASFGLVNNLVREKKLPNMCIVLNGIDMSKKKYGYYYGYGKYGKYGRYGRYGSYGNYGSYGSYGSYGNYANSHYGNANDNSIKK